MSELKLYNTMNREKVTFIPLVPGEVRMYSCGPTVYNQPHIGNLRTFLWSDLREDHLPRSLPPGTAEPGPVKRSAWARRLSH